MMFFIYLWITVFFIVFLFMLRVAFGSYKELKEEGWSDKQIAAIKTFFHTNKDLK